MGVPNSEVGYTSATARRGDHESSYEHAVALERKKTFIRDSLPAVEVQLKIHFVGNFCKKSLIFYLQ